MSNEMEREKNGFGRLEERLAGSSKFKKFIRALGITVVVLLAMVMGIIAFTEDSTDTGDGTPIEDTSKEDTSFVALDAKVVFAGSQLTIHNLEEKNWEDCRFVLNATNFFNTNGYEYTLGFALKPGFDLGVGYEHFVKSDGTRFNRSITVPVSLSLFCEVEGELRTGAWGK